MGGFLFYLWWYGVHKQKLIRPILKHTSLAKYNIEFVNTNFNYQNLWSNVWCWIFKRPKAFFFFFLGWISTHQSQNKDKIKGNLDTFESWLNIWKLNKTIDYFNKLLFKINYSNTLTNLELYYYYSLLNHSSK